MNRDKLDNELRHKLGEARVEPPSAMWNRIAATLGEKGLTATGTPDATAPAPAIHIRRPRRMRFGWAAAAVAVVALGVFTLWRTSPDQTAIPQVAQDGFIIVDPAQVIANHADTAEPPVQEPPVRERVRETVRRRVAGSETGQTQGVLVASAEVVQETAIGTVEETTQDTTTETPETVAEPPVKREGTTVTQTQRNTSDRGRGEPAYPFPGAEAGNKRRAAPVNIGVYSANLGATGNEKIVNTNSGLRAAASDLAVTETSSNSALLSTTSQNTIKLKHKMPLSGGISVTKGLTGRLALETGVTYTYMVSESENKAGSTAVYDIEQKLHYVGIPVGVKYDVLQSRRVDLYASASALFEMCVSSEQTKKLRDAGSNVTSKATKESLNVRGIQPSVGVHVGAEVKLAHNLGLYVEPGMNYYFETDKQPESYRTENPLNFSLRAGFRISLK